MRKLLYYFQLTKPSIMVLVLITGAVALIMEGGTLSRPVDFALILLGLYLTGGGANALNQCFERDRDAQMSRTRLRRPLPTGKLSTIPAFVFSTGIAIAGVILFAVFFNWASAWVSFVTVVFYSLLYTIVLKPYTAQNIVIGGAAGAMAPIIAWVAATGSIAIIPVLLFLIIFLWTPPHFWALALYYKKDYESIAMPMMPVVRGDVSTLNQMSWYIALLMGASLALAYYIPGFLYALTAAGAGGWFLHLNLQARRTQERRQYFGLFSFSLVYLFVLFIAMSLDWKIL